MNILRTNTFRYLFVYFLMLACIAGYYEFTWLGLPEKSPAGRYDTRTLLFCIGAGFALALCLPRRAWRLPFVVLWALSVLLIPLNWWNYAFYQDTLVFSSLRHGLDAIEGTRALGSLGYIGEALIGGALLSAIMIFALLYAPAPVRTRSIHAGIALLMVFLASQQHARYLDRESGIPAIDTHPVMSFVRSIYMPGGQVQPAHVDALTILRQDLGASPWRDTHPLYTLPVTTDTPKPRQENVIILVLESVRASETGLYAGTTLTPNLDRIAEKATVVTEFYANATQTVRAEMAFLCGVLDYPRGAPFSSYGVPVKTRCLPEILKEHGYQTHWFHGFTREFFNRGVFLPNIGFDHIHDQAVIENTWPAVNQLGWGIADQDVIRYALETLSREPEPFFAEILTLTNHFPFHWAWNDVRWPHAGTVPESASIMENYRTGIRYTDFVLGKFWDAFQASPLADNTALLIVGDHGVWVFDEESPESQLLRHEQLFRVPFLAVLPSRAPSQIERVGSQVDIPPSLLAYLGISEPSAFLGVDILGKSDPREEEFAVMLRGSGFGLRLGQTYCFPNSGTCSNDATSQACGSAAFQPGPVHCVAADHDLLTALSVDGLGAAETDAAFVQDIINYMGLAHVRGFMPATQDETKVLATKLLKQ